MHPIVSSNDVPCTADMTDSEGIAARLALRRGQSVQLTFDDGHPPEFHSEGNIYRVVGTDVRHNNAGQESYFHVYFGSADVQSIDDPLFKTTVCRDVPSRSRGRYKEDAQWCTSWTQHRHGHHLNRTPKWRGQADYDLACIEIVEERERCPTCGHREHPA